jgi:hypothetical protein
MLTRSTTCATSRISRDRSKDKNNSLMFTVMRSWAEGK